MPSRRNSVERTWSSDMYHYWLLMTWPVVVFISLFLFVFTSIVFAWIYQRFPGGIGNAEPGSFRDAFFFSVQTLTTLGYGYMYPKTVAANVIACIETFVGLSGFAITAGLMFSKFSRPTSRVMFSNIAVINTKSSPPTLSLRLTNIRKNQIADAIVHGILIISEKDEHAHITKRYIDITFTRPSIPLLPSSWTLTHIIDEKSPLYQENESTFLENKPELVITFTGIDDTFHQTILARHHYTTEQIIWQAMLEPLDSEKIDKSLFHSFRVLD